MTYEQAIAELERWAKSSDLTKDEEDELIVDALAGGHQRAIDASRRRGLLHAAEFLRLVPPCSLPVVDTKDLNNLPPGFWDGDVYVLAPDAPTVVG